MDHIHIDYNYGANYERINSFVNAKRNNMGCDLNLHIKICVYAISDDALNSIKFILTKVKKVWDVMISFKPCEIYGKKFCNNIAKVCKLFSDVYELHLYSIDSPSHFVYSMSEYIIILQNANTRMLMLNQYFKLDDNLAKIINENCGIENVTMNFDSHALKWSKSSISKINTVNINYDLNTISDGKSYKLFELASNVKNLTFSYVDDTWCIHYLHFETLKIIIDFVIKSAHFDNLHFYNCFLGAEKIEYICNNLMNCNINSISFDEFDGYEQSSIESIANMIKNNRSLKMIHVNTINSCAQLLTLIESLVESNIEEFDSILPIEMSNQVDSIRDLVTDILSKNYSLVSFSVKLKWSHDECFDTDPIINRNIRLLNERRFAKTKMATTIE